MAGRENLSIELLLRALGVEQTETGLRRVSDATGQLGDSTRRAGGDADEAEVSFRKLRGAFAAIGVAALAREFVQLNTQYEASAKALESVTGSSESATEQLSYLDSLADRLGQSALDLTEQYTGLAAATKGTALEGQATRDVFEAVVGAMSKLGKSGAETQRALLAIQQMASKGVVSAEELRQQLGEALPGAMQSLANASGIAAEDLNKMLESGQLLAADVLPALAKGLNETFGLDSSKQVDTLGASVARLENAMTRAFTAPGQNGLAEAFSVIINSATKAVTGLTGGTVALGRNIGALGAYVAGAIPSFDALLDAIKENADAEREFSERSQEVAKAATEQSVALQQLSQASLKSAHEYAEQSDQAKKAAEAIKVQGEATAKAAQAYLELARLGGDWREVLQATQAVEQAEALAAQNNADAQARVAEVTRRRIDDINTQIKSLGELVAASEQERTSIEAGIASRKNQAEELDKTLAKQDAEAKKAAEVAAAQALVATKARLATEVYGDQSKEVTKLTRALEQAKDVYAGIQATQRTAKDSAEALKEVQAQLTKAEQDYRAALEQGGAALINAARIQEDLRKKRDELTRAVEAGVIADRNAGPAQERVAELTARRRDALADLVAAQRIHTEALQRETALVSAQYGVRIQQLQALQAEAIARGDTAAAARIALQVAQEEARQAVAVAAAKREEAAAYAEAAQKIADKAAADRDETAETRASIQAARDAAEAKRLEANAADAAARASRAQAVELRNAHQSTKTSAEDAAGAVSVLGDETEAAGSKALAFFKFMNDWLDGLERGLAELSPKAAESFRAIVNTMDEFGFHTVQTRSAVEQMTGAIADTNAEINRLETRKFFVSNDIAKWFYDTALAAERVRRDFQEQELAAWGLTQQLSRMGSATEEVITNAQRAADNFTLLGDSDLSPLRAQIQRLKSESESLADSVQNTIDRLRDELSRLRGDQEGIEQRDFLREQKKLEEQLAQAQKDGHLELIAQIREAMTLLQQAHAEKLAQIRAEAAAQQKADNAVAENRNRINVDTGGKFGGPAIVQPDQSGTQTNTRPLAGALTTVAAPAAAAPPPTRTIRVELASGTRQAALIADESQADALLSILQTAQLRAL